MSEEERNLDGTVLPEHVTDTGRELQPKPCKCPCHLGPDMECLRGGCCYGPYLCNSELNRGADG